MSDRKKWRGEDRTWLLLGEMEEKARCRLVGGHSQRQTHPGVLRGQDPKPSEDMGVGWERTGTEGNQVHQPGSQR